MTTYIKIASPILQVNETIAEQNKKLFAENNIFTVNLMSAPGSGKTSLLVKTVEQLKDEIPLGIIEGDISTTLDAQRFKKYNIPVVQINTDKIGGDCHIDANMVKSALVKLPLNKIKLLIIENVGNLVCPAEFNVGESKKVMILSVAEGDEKPLKYPLMFRVSDLLLLNKIDLLPYCDFSREKFRKNVHQINPKLKILEISVKENKNLDLFISWIKKNIKK